MTLGVPSRREGELAQEVAELRSDNADLERREAQRQKQLARLDEKFECLRKQYGGMALNPSCPCLWCAVNTSIQELLE